MYDTEGNNKQTDLPDNVESEKLSHVKELPIVDVKLIIQQNEKNR